MKSKLITVKCFPCDALEGGNVFFGILEVLPGPMGPRDFAATVERR